MNTHSAYRQPVVPAEPAGPGVRVTGVTSHEWGRVAEDGTVYVRTADGERSVGQVPDASPEEALKFFTERYAALEFEVGLLEQRVRAGKLSPDEAASSVKTVRDQAAEANAVGDLTALVGRLDALAPEIAEQRHLRKAEKAQRSAESREAKEKIVGEAEKIAGGRDWRGGANRLRDLLEEWKALPRLDKKTDDALWKRFSSARTAYTKARKAHFAEQSEQREGAKTIKERLIREAEALSGSTDWGPTSGKYRDLMREWKAAGPAPRDVDEKLWRRFRAAQDVFFSARDEANKAMDEEFAANAVVKEQILVEAEALDPRADLEGAKRAFRDLADRWDAAGKVPRDKMKSLEGRMRKVEQSIRAVEDEQWKRSDPEKSARADDMVSKLEAGLAETQEKLDKARAAGDDKRVRDLESELENKQSFLEMARKVSSEFSG
ncbi:DUF349 domain-containing protein [Nocardioides rotundus]|nr:DUF349 domain-containing protein [Nocardioides rotundus]